MPENELVRILNDPDFQNLPEQDKQIIMSQISGEGSRPPEVPEVERRMHFTPPMPPWKEGEQLDIESPSKLELLDWLPAAGGALGSLTRTPMGSALGAAGGEAARMGIRNKLGYAPATGFVQSIAGLDPNSKLAMAVNLGVEGSTAGLGEKFAQFLASKAPGIREWALKHYARGLTPKGAGERGVEDVVRAIRPIEEELPTGTGGRIARVGEKEAKEAGRVKGEVYDAAANQPSTYYPASNKMKEKAVDLIETPGIPRKPPQPARPPTVVDEDLYKAFLEKSDELRDAQVGRILHDISQNKSSGGIRVSDVDKRRMALGGQIERAEDAAWRPGMAPKDFGANVQAMREQYKSLSDTLHGKLKGTTAVPAASVKLSSGEIAKLTGEEADALFHAWKTVERGEAGSSQFLARWAAARGVAAAGVGPVVSTAAGVLANQKMLWRSLDRKALRALATALEAGDKPMVTQILRGALTPSVGREQKNEGQ